MVYQREKSHLIFNSGITLPGYLGTSFCYFDLNVFWASWPQFFLIRAQHLVPCGLINFLFQVFQHDTTCSLDIRFSVSVLGFEARYSKWKIMDLALDPSSAGLLAVTMGTWMTISELYFSLSSVEMTLFLSRKEAVRMKWGHVCQMPGINN